tara:strand:+ start:11422 stop:11796 length:375 start_codon:yes stop_codon:yes gene_type:complete
VTIPLFFLIDLVWLGWIGRKFYQEQIGFLMGPVNWPAAILFYLIYIAGIIFFAVYPALSGGTVHKAFVLGALLGFFAYATYDLTNLATLKDWPLTMVVVDMVWGTLLTGCVAAASFLVAKNFIF